MNTLSTKFVFDIGVMLPEILVAAAALLLVLIGLLIPAGARKGMLPLTVFALLGILGFVFYDFFAGTVSSFGDGMYLHDQFAGFFKILFLTAGILVVLSSGGYVQKLSNHRGEFYPLILTALLGMMVMSGAGDMISLYVGMELMTISFYILVAYSGNERSSEAGIKYLVLGAASSAVLLYGVSLLYGLTGSTQFSEIAAGMVYDFSPVALLATVFILTGLGFKISLVPFHLWAPDIYEGAPTPVTAFLAVASKAAAFAAIVRIFMFVLPDQLGGENMTGIALLIILALMTMIIGNLAAIPQTNIKRLLAYSGIAQAGYLLVGIIAGTTAGVKGVLFYSMIYVFANLGAFAVVIRVGEVQNSDEIRDYAGMSRRSPLAAAVLTACLLSLAGIPPLAGFAGKFYLFSAGMAQGYDILAYVGLVMSMVSVYYYLKVVKIMYWGEGENLPDVSIKGASKFTMVFALLITLFLGFYPTPLAQMALSAAQNLFK